MMNGEEENTEFLSYPFISGHLGQDWHVPHSARVYMEGHNIAHKFIQLDASSKDL